MLEQQYDYYRSTIGTIIVYALGIVIAFGITLAVQRTNGKYILDHDWYSHPKGKLIATVYVLIFISSWLAYFITLNKLDDEMRIIRTHLVTTNKITPPEVTLLERSKKVQL